MCVGSFIFAGNGSKEEIASLGINDVEAIAACEVSRNGKVVFQCDGEDETCKGSYTKPIVGKVDLECSGKKVTGDD